MEKAEEKQNYWTAQLLPLYSVDKGNYSLVNRLQQEVCIQNNLFGMGWSDDGNTEIHLWRELFGSYKLNYIDNKKDNTVSKEKAKEIINNAKELIDEINKIRKRKNLEEKNKIRKEKKLDEINKKGLDKIIIKEENVDILNLFATIHNGIWGEADNLIKAINNYKTIKKDDIVIARLRNGKYCIGRVSSNEIKLINGTIAKKQDEILKDVESTGFSWYMSVYKWFQIDESMIPGHISGRFSGRSSRKTICIVSNKYKHMRQLMNILYASREKKDKQFENNILNINTDPILINAENIAESLSPYELEDLAYLYIMKKYEKEGFKLLPSKCKLDEVRYECYIINEKNPSRVIAFQTKNKERLECSEYIDNNIDLERIYLYSSLGYNWNYKAISDNTYDEEKEKEEEKIKAIKQIINSNKLEIISNHDLFETFKESNYYKEQLKRGYYKLK